MKLILIDGKDARLYVAASLAGPFAEDDVLPGAGSYEESGGEAPERDVVAFEGVGSRTGRPRAPSISVGLVSYLPHMPQVDLCVDAFRAGTALAFRIETVERQIFTQVSAAENTAAVAAATGLVTIAGADLPPLGDDSEIARGAVLKLGAERLPVLRVTDTEIFVKRPANDLAAAQDYSFVVPALRKTYLATIRTGDRSTVGAESDLASGFDLRPLGVLPKWSMI